MVFTDIPPSPEIDYLFRHNTETLLDYAVSFKGWFGCIFSFSLWFCMCSCFHLFYWTSWRFVSNVWHKSVFWNLTGQKRFESLSVLPCGLQHVRAKDWVIKTNGCVQKKDGWPSMLVVVSFDEHRKNIHVIQFSHISLRDVLTHNLPEWCHVPVHKSTNSHGACMNHVNITRQIALNFFGSAVK